MNEKRIETTESPCLNVPSFPAKLTVIGWPGSAVIGKGLDIAADPADLDTIIVSGTGEAVMRVPHQSRLKIGTAVGPLIIKHVEGGIEIDSTEKPVTLNDVGPFLIREIGAGLNAENLNGLLHLDQVKGDINLRNTADIEIGQMAGNLAVRYTNGAIRLNRVDGDLSLHTVNGNIRLEECTGSIRLGNLGGQNHITGAAGEIRLLGGLVNGEHLLQTEGDILVAWPADAPLTLLATAARINNHLPHLMSASASTADDLTTLTGNIERGKAYLTLKTTGQITLRGLSMDGKSLLDEADFDFTPPALTLEDLVQTAVNQSLTQVDPNEIERVTRAIYNRLESQISEWRDSPVESPLLVAKKRSVRHAQEEAEKAVRQTSPLKIPTHHAGEDQEEELRPSQEQILRLLKEDRITIKQANLLLDALKESKQ